MFPVVNACTLEDDILKKLMLIRISDKKDNVAFFSLYNPAVDIDYPG